MFTVYLIDRVCGFSRFQRIDTCASRRLCRRAARGHGRGTYVVCDESGRFKVVDRFSVELRLVTVSVPVPQLTGVRGKWATNLTEGGDVLGRADRPRQEGDRGG